MEITNVKAIHTVVWWSLDNCLWTGPRTSEHATIQISVPSSQLTQNLVVVVRLKTEMKATKLRVTLVLQQPANQSNLSSLLVLDRDRAFTGVIYLVDLQEFRTD